MRKDQILDSLGRIDDQVIQKVNEARNARKPKLQFRRWAAFAACFVLILSMALTAEATNGTVSNLLAPLFGGAQTEIVDTIGVPVGASTSVNGYTLTVDAIIGDRYSVMIAYTLTRDDGKPIPNNIDFDSQEVRASGYRTRIEIDEDNPSVAHFHERWHRNEPLFGRIITPSFSDLVTNKGKENESLIAEGTWEITFTIRYPDTSEKIPVRNLNVYDENGKRYRVKEIILSNMGVHMEVVVYDPVFAEASYISFQTALLLKDGTEVPLEGGGGGKMTEGDKTRKFSYYGEFDIPIPREDIQAIVICGTTYELNNSN
jgi:hypothetical protein